jgi:hypothetical protein
MSNDHQRGGRDKRRPRFILAESKAKNQTSAPFSHFRPTALKVVQKHEEPAKPFP